MEYNTKTRMGIWLCLLLMLLVLALVLTGVFDTAAKTLDRAASATMPSDEAIYVNAKPQPTTAQALPPETTEAPPEATTEAAAQETERKPLFYVTVSGTRVVLLDEYGEFLKTLNENALFLPQEDLNALRAGIALYSKEEAIALAEDLS